MYTVQDLVVAIAAEGNLASVEWQIGVAVERSARTLEAAGGIAASCRLRVVALVAQSSGLGWDLVDCTEVLWVLLDLAVRHRG
jgi:hypothetical protein